MKVCLAFFSLVVLFVSFNVLANKEKSHDIDYPKGWQTWAPIAVSHRTDNNTLRVIIGNDIAVKAARSSNTKPWPDGAIIGKVVWTSKKLNDWQLAVAPAELIHAEFMFKDNYKFRDTHGWGWARWVGTEQVAFNKGTNICISCHEPVKERDWVFTEPAVFPN